jgi:hypothetical protein
VIVEEAIPTVRSALLNSIENCVEEKPVFKDGVCKRFVYGVQLLRLAVTAAPPTTPTSFHSKRWKIIGRSLISSK